MASRGQERKLVTILFADVTGSTTLGEQLDPERLRDVMDTYFDAMREEIDAEGGTVEKFIGDAVMAAFGVPLAHEDDPARALRAGLKMLRRLPEVNGRLEAAHSVSLRIRIGVHTGEVLATVDPRPGEAMVTGDAVNTAARLQAAAEPGELLASERTVEAARGFAFNDRGELDLKGKRERVRAFVVIEETGGPVRGLPGLRAPMVGRDAELDLLRSVYERAVHETRPHLVTVYGDAGVGKSRLCQEFLHWTEARSPRPLLLSGRCLPYGDGITYWPLAEILKGLSGIFDTDPTELAVEKVRKTGHDLLTSEVSSNPARATAALAYTIGLEDPDVSFAGLDPNDVRIEVHAAWRSFFTGLAIAGPVVVVVEDIHWADPALLDLLEELADRSQGSVLFVCPSRPDLTATRPGWGGGRRNASSLALDPLTTGEAQQLVKALLTVDDLPPSVHERILERAEGNPFFLEEVIRRLVDGGLIHRSGERWRAVEGIEQVHIPDTVQAVLAARIDLLELSDKRVLQAAAVVGRVFWPGPLLDLTGVEAAALNAALRRLEDREFVRSKTGSSLAGQSEFVFNHILTRDVAYESLPLKERPDAHTSVARWLERTAGDRAGEFAELLAYHFSTAASLAAGSGVKPDEALRAAALSWLLRASSDTRRRNIVEKAVRFAEEALPLAVDPIERTDALESLAEAFLANYVGDLAWRYFREAAFTRAGAEPPDGSRVAYLAARACEITIRWPGSMTGIPPEPEVREVRDLGLAHVPEGDSEERARLMGIRAGWLFAFPDAEYLEGLGTPEELEAAGVEAAEMALRLGLPNLASGSLDNATAAWLARGNYRKALPLWKRRGEIMPLVTDSFEIGDYWAMGVWAHYELNDYLEACRLAEIGELVSSNRGPNVELHLLAWKVATLFRLGRWDEALTAFARLRDLLDERRDRPPYFTTHAFGAAAQIHTARGNRVESDRLAQLLLEQTEPSARAYPWKLRLLVMRGELDAARALALPTAWRIHAGDAYGARAELVAAARDFELAGTLVSEMRAHAAETGAAAVLPIADRLEGRVALHADDAATATILIRRSVAGFEELGCPWERALSESDLARACRADGRTDEAETILARARSTFLELGAAMDGDLLYP